MRRLKILIWHIQGSYLDALTRLDHEWYVPMTCDGSRGYPDPSGSVMPDNIHQLPAEHVPGLDLDLVICQTAKNYFEDQYGVLSVEQRMLPMIYLEHSPPAEHAVDAIHPVAPVVDPDILLVHVSHYNRLMWDNGQVQTMVIEPAAVVDPGVHYIGHLYRGIAVVDRNHSCPRVAGHDIVEEVQKVVPLDVADEMTASVDPGDALHAEHQRRWAEYRFLFSPIRYGSVPVAVIEAMAIGLPVVALATTELPSLIENGKSGFVSCNVDEIVAHMLFLLKNPDEARRLGAGAQVTAMKHFGMDRFRRDWELAFERALELRRSTVTLPR